MDSVFVDDKLYRDFESNLRKWIGTPYKHFTMVRGRGADCVLFVMACYKEAGLISYVNTKDYYPRDWWRHGGGEFIREQAIEHITKYAINKKHKAIWIDKGVDDELYRGDMLGFAFSKTGITHHCGILLDSKEEFIHSINIRGVAVVPYLPWWERHRTGISRIVTE